MKYRLKKETKPTLPTFGKYKAVAVHYHTVESRQLIKEVAQRMGTHTSNVLAVMTSVAEVVNNHLREGDRVRLEDWGMMKLEIESVKVDNLKVVPATFSGLWFDVGKGLKIVSPI